MSFRLENVSSYKPSFYKLNFFQKVAVSITVALVAIGTFGFAAKKVYKKLLNHFTKIDGVNKPTLEVADRVDALAVKAQIKSVEELEESSSEEEDLLFIQEELDHSENSLTKSQNLSASQKIRRVKQEFLETQLINLFWQAASDPFFNKPEIIKIDQVEELIEEFINYETEKLGQFELAANYRTFLKDHILSVLQDDKTIQFPYAISNEKALHRVTTVGGGSTGLHALLGEGYPIECDAPKSREIFCKVLKKFFVKDKLPNSIKIILKDFFARPGHAFYKDLYKALPKKKNATGIKENLRDFYFNESTKSEEERIDAFIKDPQVFECYLNELRKTTRYLAQEEFLVAAHIFNCKVRLFRPGWGKDKDKLKEQIISKGKREVLIYYTAENRQYERLEITTL